MHEERGVASKEPYPFPDIWDPLKRHRQGVWLVAEESLARKEAAYAGKLQPLSWNRRLGCVA